MRETIVHVAQDSAIYGLGEVSSRAVSFLLVPLYSRFFSAAEYGLLSVILVILPLLADAVNLGINSAFLRYFFEDEAGEHPEKVISTALYFNMISSFVVLGCLWLLAGQLALLLTGQPGMGFFLKMGLASVFFANLGRFGLTMFRVRRQAWFYAQTSFLRLTLSLALNVYFVAVLKMGIGGVLLGQLVTEIVVASVLLARVVVVNVKVVFSFRLLKGMLAFGIPLIPVNLAYWLIASAPVPLLARLSNLSASGLFSMGSRFATVLVVLLVFPFQLGWAPVAYAIHSEERLASEASRILTYTTGIAVAAGLALSLMAKDLLAIFSTPEFASADRVIGVLTLGIVFYAVSINFAVILNHRKKTHYNALAWAGGAVASLLLSFIMIPRIGDLGASVANVAGFLVVLGVSVFAVQKTFPLRAELSRLGKIAGLSAVLFLLGRLVELPSVWLDASLKIVLVLAFPFILYLLGFFQKAEIAGIMSFFHRPRTAN